METHFFNLVAYAVLVSAMFALFMREERGDRIRFAAVLSLSMVGIAVAAAWLMALVR